MRLPAWFTERPVSAAPETELRVSTLELFFDLVFVFTITQLTALLVVGLDVAQPGHRAVGIGESALQVLLVFGVMWWMYSGYVWLLNSVPPVRPARRILVLLGMTGFLIMALAIPTTFSGGGVAFAVGYLLLILVHGALYLQATRAIMRVVPFNLAATALIGAAGFLDPPYAYLPWAAALVLLWGSPYFIGQQGFTLRAPHVVERHGLLVIVVLGESMLAIGIGAADLEVGLGLGVAGAFGLCLGACLWWAYFGGDDETAAEHTLAAAEPVRRTRMILGAYFYGHIPLLLGVVAVSGGIKKVIGHPFDPLKPSAAIILATGVALYLAGDFWFRRVLKLSWARLRGVAAVLALAAAVAGLWAALAELAILVLLLVAVLLVEHRRRTPHVSL
ncbi:low temperature requirement protein A [Nonomuraea jiangxiensis]|uniref:Low temperature requirement protein LtrA n=1 Tax=Nonomuraea jiangxiensis TaxID=633440 RepID=A0A1G8J8P4_9ACTN|nr:low temperature requirement protein A [Nonomuraea jiangxiensis]SDI27624.1 Low temperature requirement protein LtrA [Nonomuraea jiangxiensis]